MPNLINKNKMILIYILFIVNITVVSFYNMSSVISVIYSLALLSIINRTIFKLDKKVLFFSFNFYLTLMLILFFSQFVSYPNMYGLNPIGNNADDLFFYFQASSYIPEDIVFSFKSVQDLHPFSIVLMFINYPLSLFFQLLPIDYLFINVMVLSFLPGLSAKLSHYLKNDFRLDRLVYWLTILCPFIAMNGLILIRDGWTAVLLVGILLLIFMRKYGRSLLLLALLFYIRAASGLEFIIVLSLFIFNFARDRSNRFRKLKLLSQILISLSPVLVLVMYYFLKGYIVNQLGGEALFRVSFLNTFMQNYSDSFFYRIMQFPIIIRLPIGMIYFVFSPYFSEPFFTNGHFLPRSIFNTVFVIENLILVKYFISGCITSIEKNDRMIKTIMFAFLLSMLVLSQISMQIRHKTMFMPLYYILVSYGVYYGSKSSKWIGVFVSVLLSLVHITILFL